MSPKDALIVTVLLLLATTSAIVTADSVQPPPECARMAFALDQLHSAPAVGEKDVVKQYKSAINIAMKCMDSYLKVQKELFNEWLKHVSGLEKQLQHIVKRGEEVRDEL
uniref:Uncharacterized protein n=1 Tax=Globodera rostochiensis TaxID=31243 RepID=A0A914I5K1_GLORO